MPVFRLPHEYVMRLNAELRSPEATWIEGRPPEKISKAFVAAASISDIYEMQAAEVAMRRGGDGVRAMARSLLPERRRKGRGCAPL